MSSDRSGFRDDVSDGRGKGRGRGRGKGRGKPRGGGNGRGDGSDLPPWLSGGPTPALLEGEWLDSLGHTVTVEGGQLPLNATLRRGTKAQALSLRCDPSSGAWACGNALLDLASSGPSCLVWTTSDGRRSVWWRERSNEQAEEDERPPELLPWLLVPEAIGGFLRGADRSSSGKPRWATITEEEDEAADRSEGESGEAVSRVVSSKSAKSTRSARKEDDKDSGLDCSRVNAILNVRQVFGSDHKSQERLNFIIMDHDLVRKPDEDVMVPGPESPLWQRLAETPRRNALQILANFSPSERDGIASPAAADFSEFRCGRHRIPAAATDVQALMRRYSGPNDLSRRANCVAHVISLYRAMENPLVPFWQRNDMQLSWDAALRQRSNVHYELFASPFNARVPNGNYASRFPHAEAEFGSIGSYPSVIDKIPAEATIGVNPPFSDAYLEHVVGQSLDKLVDRFARVHLTVPVREAPWRQRLQKLEGTSLIQQFWDATASADKPLSHPVLYWNGGQRR